MSFHVERSEWEGVGSKQPDVVTSRKERYRCILAVNMKASNQTARATHGQIECNESSLLRILSWPSYDACPVVIWAKEICVRRLRGSTSWCLAWKYDCASCCSQCHKRPQGVTPSDK